MLFSRLVTLSICYVSTVAATSDYVWTSLVKDRVASSFQSLNHAALPSIEQSAAEAVQLPPGITQHYFEQKLDHFNESCHQTFYMRYWKSIRHYQKGGPIIVFLAGEAAADYRMPVLDYGIIDIITRETNGMGLILEHRYYGHSKPVPDYTTKNLKWLTLDLALADVVNFAQNVDLGYGELTKSPNSPWFTYGGSYAGAQSAFLRAQTPDTIFGAIASSAVVIAKIDFWEYRETIRKTGGLCSQRIVQLVDHIDGILAKHNKLETYALKLAYGLGELRNDLDFVQTIRAPFGQWQLQKWEIPDSNNLWLRYCSLLEANVSTLSTPAQQFQQVLANHQNMVKRSVHKQCPDRNGKSRIEECYSISGPSLKIVLADQTWNDRPWAYLTCTSIGFFSPAAPAGVPSMISRLIDLEAVNYCPDLFDDLPSVIPLLPDLTRYNYYGELAMSKKVDRIMFIDGDKDPWLYATAHSPYAPARADTPQNPFKMIKGGVHHWDETGVRPGSELVIPATIAEVQREEVATIKRWMEEWFRLRSEQQD